jgi:polar amino acid transport system substrate-binding protein
MLLRALLCWAVLCLASAGPICAQDRAAAPEARPAAAGTLRIATIERKPFAFRAAEGWTGFSIELWQDVAERLGLRTEFVEFDRFADMLAAVTESRVDAAVANISITHAREQVLDFSQPIYDSGLLVLKPLDGAPSLFDALVQPDLLKLLGLAAAVLFVFANLIWLAERRTETFRGQGWHKGFGEGLWWSVNVVTNASFTIFSPQTWVGRMLAYGLILIGLFVVSAFVAQITTALTVGELRSQVSGFEDLRDKRVGTTAPSTSERFLRAESIAFRPFETITGLFDALEAGDLDAVVHDAPILEYYARTAGQGRFVTVGRVFNPEKYGIAFPQGSALREDVDQALLFLRESGAYAVIDGRWFAK